MSEQWKKWVEVAKEVSANSNADVRCPICNTAKLAVWDEHWEKDSNRWERHMRCPKCGATNSILMKQKKEVD